MTTTRKFPAKIALLKSMEELLHHKSFAKISVNELCQHAQISRSAFYANFADKYELFEFCLYERYSQMDSVLSSYTPKDFILDLLERIQTEQRFFYNAFGASDDDEIKEIFYQFFDQQFTALLNKKVEQGMVLPGPVEIVSAFYIGGIFNTLFRWIKSNYKISKDELAACQFELIKDLI